MRDIGAPKRIDPVTRLRGTATGPFCAGSRIIDAGLLGVDTERSI